MYYTYLPIFSRKQYKHMHKRLPMRQFLMSKKWSWYWFKQVSVYIEEQKCCCWCLTHIRCLKVIVWMNTFLHCLYNKYLLQVPNHTTTLREDVINTTSQRRKLMNRDTPLILAQWGVEGRVEGFISTSV